MKPQDVSGAPRALPSPSRDAAAGRPCGAESDGGAFSRVRDWVDVNVLGTGHCEAEHYRARDPHRAVKVAGGVVGGAASFVGASPEVLKGTVQHDKVLHAGCTFTGTMVFGTVFCLPPLLASAFAFLGATVGKELVWDLYLGKGCPDVRDAMANFAGACEGYAALKAMEGVTAERTAPAQA